MPKKSGSLKFFIFKIPYIHFREDLQPKVYTSVFLTITSLRYHNFLHQSFSIFFGTYLIFESQNEHKSNEFHVNLNMTSFFFMIMALAFQLYLIGTVGGRK